MRGPPIILIQGEDTLRLPTPFFTRRRQAYFAADRADDLQSTPQPTCCPSRPRYLQHATVQSCSAVQSWAIQLCADTPTMFDLLRWLFMSCGWTFIPGLHRPLHTSNTTTKAGCPETSKRDHHAVKRLVHRREQRATEERELREYERENMAPLCEDLRSRAHWHWTTVNYYQHGVGAYEDCDPFDLIQGGEKSGFMTRRRSASSFRARSSPIQPPIPILRTNHHEAYRDGVATKAKKMSQLVHLRHWWCASQGRGLAKTEVLVEIETSPK